MIAGGVRSDAKGCLMTPVDQGGYQAYDGGPLGREWRTHEMAAFQSGMFIGQG